MYTKPNIAEEKGYDALNPWLRNPRNPQEVMPTRLIELNGEVEPSGNKGQPAS